MKAKFRLSNQKEMKKQKTRLPQGAAAAAAVPREMQDIQRNTCKKMGTGPAMKTPRITGCSETISRRVFELCPPCPSFPTNRSTTEICERKHKSTHTTQTRAHDIGVERRPDASRTSPIPCGKRLAYKSSLKHRLMFPLYLAAPRRA